MSRLDEVASWLADHDREDSGYRVIGVSDTGAGFLSVFVSYFDAPFPVELYGRVFVFESWSEGMISQESGGVLASMRDLYTAIEEFPFTVGSDSAAELEGGQWPGVTLWRR